MYHSVIGKRLVESVNARDGKSYTVREFYDEVYAPAVFGGERMLQFVNNSPFAQAINNRKETVTPELIASCLSKVHARVTNDAPDSSFYLGGPNSTRDDSMSGQLTSMQLRVPEEDIYASWIGAAVGLTVQGGINLLVDAPHVLCTIYDGWKAYRRYLEQRPAIKPMQINTWNTHWLIEQLEGEEYDYSLNKDKTAIETASWARLFFALSQHYSSAGAPCTRLLAYVYSLGQSNTTLGFVQLALRDAKGLFDTYMQLFEAPPGMYHAQFAALYDTEEGFRAACTRPEIGLRALRPRDVFKADKAVPKAPDRSDYDRRFSFDLYQTWIIAMLNNKDLPERAERLAEALNQFVEQNSRLTVNKNLVETELLHKRGKREFLDELTGIVKKDPAHSELYNQVATDLTSMAFDDVSLFLTLVRFKYAVVQARQKNGESS